MISKNIHDDPTIFELKSESFQNIFGKKSFGKIFVILCAYIFLSKNKKKEQPNYPRGHEYLLVGTGNHMTIYEYYIN